MLKRTGFCLIAIMLVVALLSGCAGADEEVAVEPVAPDDETEVSEPQEDENIMEMHLKLMTGSAGGVWFPTGAAIAEFLENDYPGLVITMTPGGGVSNIAAMQAGETDLGFGKACSTVDGLEGREPFTEKTVDVRELAYLDEEIFQIIVPADSPIKSIADIKGMVLTTAQKGNTTELMVQQLLSLYDMTYDDLKQAHFVSFTDSVTQMKDNKADVFMVSTSLPAATVLDLASSKDLRILSIETEIIDQMNSMNPGYLKTVVPAGSYDFQDEDVTTISTGLHIAVHKNMSEEVIYNITKSLVENIDEIRMVHDMYSDLTPEFMATDVGVPFHPGALRYYQEQGLVE